MDRVHLHAMTPADLDAVLALQQRCYGVGFLERREAFAAKLAVTDGLDCCWMARGDDGQTLAYAVSLPVCEATLPALDAPHCERPLSPTLLYLHDMAVAPEARSLGLATRLLARLADSVRALGLERMGLVAVQGSVPYWQRQGFAEPASLTAPLRAKLASFGADARFLTQRV
ncbi:GNAT family N-acetyltransferase [Roseateles asaccharophilus]|uniref:Ribosomal protein S18 acetylase RimI-like enzyme n=1 Tax=Roseateles asaccharophilus TaxID=582607 RepID=A0ABU2A4B6_9BURK|nr:GNAT family N-acetyltransferase [Roseateles asaccharophilus]MDR7332046.1 ribosomal protein S18 acetylase RimI-like enzyme [Roseateles asaccharophilus]